MTALAAGTIAPDFSLQSTPDQRLSLAQLRGRPVVLVFYPADWSPVCGDQLGLYNELQEEFAKSNAVVLALSVDGVWCHAAFAKDRHFHFPLLADFEPKGEVARRSACIGRRTGLQNVLFSFWTRKVSSAGATCRR
jgi:peroxiredoxin